jgi:hypothetical protein
VTDKEALELALDMLERDNLKVGNIYVNYDIQEALIKLVKKTLDGERKKKEWQGLTDEERTYLAWESNNGIHCVAMTEAKLKEKNT